MEEKVKQDLCRYLQSKGLVDERLPECQDIEDEWQQIAQSYLPDGIREFGAYPTVSLGWMMFIGMAVAKYWDDDWEQYKALPHFYEKIRDQRGFDCMDEYILEDVLQLKDEESKKLSDIVAECASRTNNLLCHAFLEPGTPEAFKGYVSCLHQLYLMGVAMQLKRMGYHMTLMDG